MPKYNIHIDKPLPSSEQIARHKNFGKLYLDYEKATRFQFWRDLRTNPRYFGTLVMVFAIGYLIYEVSKQEPMVEQPFIAAPMEMDIPYEYQEVLSGTDVILEYPSGTTISLSPAAFIDSSGQDISGRVRLAYREFRDPKDLFIAGIPMKTDSASGAFLLESGGMVEILAFKNGKRVFIKPGSRLKISFLSDKKGADFEVFRLDQEAEGWRFEGKDSVAIVLEDSDVLKGLPPKPQPRLLDIAPISIPSPSASENDPLKPKGPKPPTTDPTYASRLAAWEEKRAAIVQSLEKDAMALRTFSVSQLGYFCIGKKLNTPDSVCAFQVKDLKQASQGRLWVVQEGLNTLSEYPVSKEGDISVSVYGEKGITLWIPLGNNKLGVVSVASCGSSHEMEIEEGPFQTVEDLKIHLLGWTQ